MAYEIVSGDDEMAGYDIETGDDDLAHLLAVSGATRVRAPSGPRGPRIVQSRPTVAREYPLGFDSGTPGVGPGATATITTRPQLPFRGNRLVVPSDIGGNFLIHDLKIGNRSQFVANGAVPARTFSEQGVGVSLSLDTAMVSQDVTLVVENTSGGPVRFTASLIGVAME